MRPPLAPFDNARLGVLRPPYQLLLIDPPWEWLAWGAGGDGRSAVRHYPTMPTADIAALPVRQLAARDCAVFMWCIWDRMPDAFAVLDAWGFKYKTAAFVWIKTNPKAGTVFRGLGRSATQGNAEPCLFAVRGQPRRVWAGEAQPIFAPRREHSRKPDEVYGKCERLFGRLHRAELFARQAWPGWDAWGFERGKFRRAAA